VRACDLIAAVSIHTGVTTRSRAQNSAVRHRPCHRRRHSDPEEDHQKRASFSAAVPRHAACVLGTACIEGATAGEAETGT
jgi:hypothetical protein